MKTERYAFNRAEFQDKVLGCWYGKSIGGTLGAPYEGSREMNDVVFYPEDINGNPLPNDDLDLQLVWLTAVERHGMLDLNERILGEYWREYLTGPWNEYGVCRHNLSLGFTPPLTGAVCNDKWKWSNGAWIRSEIWACLFPGSPDKAACAAWCDACCDHKEEGIFAEIFTASLESAAFVESDLKTLLQIALARLPENSRVARAVRLAMKCYEEKVPFADARNRIVKDSEDLGWFQAPANVAFTVLGLLYGEGDFGKTVALAVNCGDDTDCTGGTAGAVMGILLGEKNIPEKWKKPIGKMIITCSIDNTCRRTYLKIPRDLDELTERVIFCAEQISQEDPFVPEFTDQASVLPEKVAGPSQAFFQFLDSKDPWAQTFDLPWGTISFACEEGPFIEQGKELKLTVRAELAYAELSNISVHFCVPEDWNAGDVAVGIHNSNHIKTCITPGIIHDPVSYIPVEIHRSGCAAPQMIFLPLIRKGSMILAVEDKAELGLGYRYSIHSIRCKELLKRFRERFF